MKHVLGFIAIACMALILVQEARSGTVTEGLKLVQVERGSIFAKLGLKNGDVIEQVNGAEIVSIDTLGEAFTKLKPGQKLELVVRRNGKATHIQYIGKQKAARHHHH